MDLDKGTLELPPVVGQFYGKHGEFYNQQIWKGRAVRGDLIPPEVSDTLVSLEQKALDARPD
ncbi:hypothetical protein [Edaphobacter aggregans]|uniref:hypothetical protein n=1 Tax=Edaphobacter aggregans TaxID=570835 RepID=UPI0021ADB637|nr:hypothetical protein [Edaphobacter aggregans]